MSSTQEKAFIFKDTSKNLIDINPVNIKLERRKFRENEMYRKQILKMSIENFNETGAIIFEYT